MTNIVAWTIIDYKNNNNYTQQKPLSIVNNFLPLKAGYTNQNIKTKYK